MAPFAAFAVATAGTLRLRSALGPMAVSLVLGSGEVFAPALLGRVALIDAAWLGGLVLVHAVLAGWVRPWRGATSRLARAS
jgi:hypothetical protein